MKTLTLNRNQEEVRAIRRQFAMAESASRAGDYAKAIQTLDGLLAQDKGHLPALELLARCQWRIGEYQPLVRTMQRLLAINPYEPGYHALLGSGLQSLGRYGEATAAYSRATEIPGCMEALNDLQSWQNALVAELYASDRIFRTRFRQNASRACAERGLRLEAPVSDRMAKGRETTLYTRPS